MISSLPVYRITCQSLHSGFQKGQPFPGIGQVTRIVLQYGAAVEIIIQGLARLLYLLKAIS